MLRLYSALIGLSLIWGFSFVFIKWLIGPAGIWGTVFIRCLAGAVILVPVLIIKYREQLKDLPWKHLIMVGIFNAGLPWGLIALSETQIDSNIAATINATTPIWTAVIGFSLFHIKLIRRQWVGIFIGFIGILILTDFNIGQLVGENFIGIGTMVLAAISYGFASQYVKRHLGQVGVVIITTFSLLTGAAIGLIGMLLTKPVNPSELMMPLPLIAVVGLGCLGSGIAHLLFYYMMKKGSPEFATTVTYLIPATAAIWGYILLNETISSHLIAGLAVIFAGVFISTRKKKTAEKTVLSHQSSSEFSREG